MELALYCPDCGYYEKESDRIGRRGDFYTSVSVGSLFGELLAFQFAEWLSTLNPQPSTLNLVEVGAHDGRLASDILNWLQIRRPTLFERIKFLIVEPSPRRQATQQATLRSFGANVNWVHRLGDLPKVHGIIFSNELLDALPAHRLGWDAEKREWFEWGVTVKAEQFVWTRLARTDHASRLTPHVPPELLEVLPEGFTTELCPAAEDRWREAAGRLEHGKLLTIDYGLSAEQFFSPERKNGTLRAYHRHRLGDDVLANPGEQDITAHVNFTAIQAAGEGAGLRTEFLETQAAFLTDLARRVLAADSGFGPWTPDQSRQFQTLTHPEHLGRAFRVLVQAK